MPGGRPVRPRCHVKTASAQSPPTSKKSNLLSGADMYSWSIGRETELPQRPGPRWRWTSCQRRHSNSPGNVLRLRHVECRQRRGPEAGSI